MSIRAHLSVAVQGRQVPVTWEANLDEATVQAALAAPKFGAWLDSFDGAILLESVHIQGVDMFGPSVGFIKLRAVAHRTDDPEKRPVPGIVLIRGHAVAILVVLHCEGRKYALLTSQARPAAGSAAMVEVVAGMLDEDKSFSGVAARELEEEAGIKVREEDLIPLSGAAYGDQSPNGVFMSPGLLDEAISLFAVQRRVSHKDLDRFRLHQGGLREEGELIRLVAVPFDDVWHRVPDAKTLAALLLFEKLEQAGRIPSCCGAPGPAGEEGRDPEG